VLIRGLPESPITGVVLRNLSLGAEANQSIAAVECVDGHVASASGVVFDGKPWAISGQCKSDDDTAGPLSVKDFGATGLGAVDDSAAIQRAIDAAQDNSTRGGAGPIMGRAVYFPSGTYLVNKTLTVATTHGNIRRPVRLFGDGMLQSKLVAGAEIDAVIRFAGTPVPATPDTITSDHIIESLQVSAAGLANYSVAAAAITRSQVRFSMFVDARVAGLLLGSGWINEVLECEPPRYR